MSKSSPIYESLDEWIAKDAYSFSIDSSSSLHVAIDHLTHSLGDSIDLLGFGESLHGGEEILLLRNRLFEYLVAAYGYTAIAIESNFPRSLAVNDYVQGVSNASYESLIQNGFSHAVGPLEANRELIEWMKRYNADSNQPKLHFYGFDSPTEMMKTESPRQLLTFVLDYLAAADNVSVHPQREHFDKLIGHDSEWENPAAMMDPAKSIGNSPMAMALRIDVEDLITELQVRRPELIKKSGHDKFNETMRYAVMSRQLLNYHATIASSSDQRVAKALGQRDVMMADNLAYIVARETARGGKVLVFAHNSHLKYGMAEWQLGPHALKLWPAGAHLRKMFGSRYAVIGSGVGASSQNGIAQPEDGTLEAKLLKPSGPVRWISTQNGKAVFESEVDRLSTRTGSTMNPSYFPFNAQSFDDFDWLVMLDSITYNRGGLYASIMQ